MSLTYGNEPCREVRGGRRGEEEWFIPSVPLCEIVVEFSSKTRNHQEAKKNNS